MFEIHGDTYEFGKCILEQRTFRSNELLCQVGHLVREQLLEIFGGIHVGDKRFLDDTHRSMSPQKRSSR